MKTLTCSTRMLALWLAFAPLHASYASTDDVAEGYLQVTIHPLIMEVPQSEVGCHDLDDVDGDEAVQQTTSIGPQTLYVWDTRPVADILQAVGLSNRGNAELNIYVEDRTGNQSEPRSVLDLDGQTLRQVHGVDATSDPSPYYAYTPQWHLPKMMGGKDFIDQEGNYYPVHSHAYGALGGVVGLLALVWVVRKVKAKPMGPC